MKFYIEKVVTVFN